MTERAPSEAIELQVYDASRHCDGVVRLFTEQYGDSPAHRADHFGRLYDMPYQAASALRIVAVDGDHVCGAQSFFRWPYTLNGVEYNTFQSGGSLVDPNYQGQGIFGRLLRWIDENPSHFDGDFLVSFPGAPAYGSFVRNGWVDAAELGWFVRPVRVGAGRKSDLRTSIGEHFATTGPEPAAEALPGSLRLAQAHDFVEWRRQFHAAPQYHFDFASAAGSVRFDLQGSRRRGANELIIGDVRRSADDPALLTTAFRALIRSARERKAVDFVSIACNLTNPDPALRKALRSALFVPLRRRIFFVVKTWKPVGFDPTDPKLWRIFRSDIDTW